MVKIFLDPGHGGSDPGAVGNGLQEKTLNLTIALRIRDMLLAEYQNVEVRMSRTGDTAVSLTQRTNLANSWGADYFMSIHINAGGGTGFESFIHTSASSGSVNAQRIIHPAIIQQIGGVNRGQKAANFAVLRTSTMPAILTENLFIDHANDAALLRDSSFLTRIARGHVNGLVQALNLQTGGGGGGTIYRVQAGAFSSRANAEALQARLRADGYEALITESGGLFRVQVGAFSVRANAVALVNELQSKGYEATIVTA
ncbi:N-acetylmuramoyl-L-alanine amidase [Shouchella patagoniensis]|uniref:N-acetylmuramoyl-L-alanine amidase n=1 Tax=Shouchella patagoniensis TaxID=228576 RepID=UPI000995032B|nr:N-acetylmuramoyl-L-alanine amidase [Shouchella patagoniensis]